VDIGDDAKYVVKGEGIVLFQLELGGSFDSHNVIYVPVMKNKFLSVSSMEDNGFSITFHRGKVLIHPEKSILDIAVDFGVRDDTLYRL
jgi:hypothetical protein